MSRATCRCAPWSSSAGRCIHSSNRSCVKTRMCKYWPAESLAQQQNQRFAPAGVAEATATAAVTTTAITAIVKRLADRRAGLCRGSNRKFWLRDRKTRHHPRFVPLKFPPVSPDVPAAVPVSSSRSPWFSSSPGCACFPSVFEDMRNTRVGPSCRHYCIRSGH